MTKETYHLKKEGNLFTTEIPSGSGVFFGFRKWTWGEKNALTSECTIIDPFTNFVRIDSIRYNETLVVRTVMKKVGENFVAITADELRSMDAQIGERLSRITQSINLVQEVEAKNL